MHERHAQAAGPALRVGDIAAAAQLACVLEAGAPKPGNVSPGHAFHDVSYEDFVASAMAIGEPLLHVAEQPLGVTIRRCVEATRRWTVANTNLGIVLLMAPLAKAAAEWRGAAQFDPASWRASLEQVLAATTVSDAREVYAAIRTASPGGLGREPSQDVWSEPTVSLLDAMRMAAHRDTIAREYATGFEVTFARGVPVLVDARQTPLSWNDAIVQLHLTILSEVRDTHITRRAGEAAAAEVSRQAQIVLDRGGVRTPDGRRTLAEFDESLRDPLNLQNPGATADLTAAALFVVLLCGRLHP